jgi:hypothetical protein
LDVFFKIGYFGPDQDSERNATGTSLYTGLLSHIPDLLMIVFGKWVEIVTAGVGKQWNLMKIKDFWICREIRFTGISGR